MRDRFGDDPVDALSIIEGEFEWDGDIGKREPDPNPDETGTTSMDAVEFNETIYLGAFPDIAEAIASGEWASGHDHYLKYGMHEDRLDDLRYRNALRRRPDTAGFPAGGIDAVFVSRRGWCLVIGWFNDEASPLHELVLMRGTRIVAIARKPARCRREDAEAVVVTTHGKLLGFWTVFHVKDGFAPNDELSLCVSTARERKTFRVQPKRQSDEQLREVALEYFASARYFSNPQFEAPLQLDHGLGKVLLDFNVEISGNILAGACVARFGPQRDHLLGSIAVCLYGKAEYLFLQAAAFSECTGIDRYEFIYVSNSPELAETLLKEATMASRIYGVSITLVILPSNAGFGAANNVAAAHARSDRIMHRQSRHLSQGSGMGAPARRAGGGSARRARPRCLACRCITMTAR